MTKADEFCFWLDRYFDALGFEVILSKSDSMLYEYDATLLNDGIDCRFSFNASHHVQPMLAAVKQVSEVMKEIILDRVNWVQRDVATGKVIDDALGHLDWRDDDKTAG